MRFSCAGNGASIFTTAFVSAGRSPLFVEVLFAAVAKPDAKDLGYFLFLGFREGVVELERALSFRTARRVPVSVPVAARQAYTAADLLSQGLAGEASRAVVLLHSKRVYPSSQDLVCARRRFSRRQVPWIWCLYPEAGYKHHV